MSPRTKGVMHLVGLLLAFLLLGVLAQDEGSVRTETILSPSAEGWTWDRVISQLRQMNTDLEKTIDDYENGRIDDAAARTRISELLRVKQDLVFRLPDIGGVPFYAVYNGLFWVDTHLLDAHEYGETKEGRLNHLRGAKYYKDALEKAVARASGATPAAP
jgi:hypothetical protein